jgi:hypothetical protein
MDPKEGQKGIVRETILPLPQIESWSTSPSPVSLPTKPPWFQSEEVIDLKVYVPSYDPHKNLNSINYKNCS